LPSTLPRRERIRRRPEYLRVQNRGARTRGRFLTVFVLPNGTDENRLGIIATRRLGSAVRRNRSKRLVREIYRRQKASFRSAGGVDIVVLPGPGFGNVAFADLERDFASTLRRHERSR